MKAITIKQLHEACNRVASLRSNIPVRATDAFYLACAAENGFTSIYSHDRHLLAAAE